MQLYGLKTCDTCKKAMKALPDAVFVDVREEGVPADVLTSALARFGSVLVNARSTTWRNLSETERALPPEVLLAGYPTVMKRPLILDGAQMHLGWSKQVQEDLAVG